MVKGVYAYVPPGTDPATFQPDMFLVTAALRQDAIFCGHSALELLGVAHSLWRTVSAYSRDRRLNEKVGSYVLKAYSAPPLSEPELGVQTLDRNGIEIRTTGPERTLLEGFLLPARVGDLEELVNSAEGFWELDFQLLKQLLRVFGKRKLYAATGWFLCRQPEKWRADPELLAWLEDHKPSSVQYLDKRMTDASLDKRWNLMVPRRLQPTGDDVATNHVPKPLRP